MPNFCENFKAVFLSETVDGKERLVARSRCKMWTCEFCAKKNRQIWRAWLMTNIDNAPKGAVWCWFTVTAHSKKRKAKASLLNIRGAWDKLIKRAKRHFGAFEYIRVYEKHADGSYHVHCLANFHFDDIKIRKSKNGIWTTYSLWLRDTVKALKLGYYTHAENIAVDASTKSIVGYITKYITKMTPEFKQEVGRVRHIQTSQGWIDAPSFTDLGWQLRHGIYLDDVINADLRDLQLRDISANHIITHKDFATNYIYPPELGLKDL